MKVKTNEAKEAYIDIKSQIYLLEVTLNGELGVPSLITLLATIIFFVSGYVNSTFLLDILFPFS